MLGRSAQPEPARAEAPAAAGEPVPDAALDAVAAVLRALAGTAAPASEAAERLEAWARHVLVLAPAPGVAAVPERRRDWVGLGRYVVGHVRDDRAATARSLNDLQDAIWVVIEGLSQAVTGDAAADSRAAEQLERLRAAASGTAEELKATALETVQRLTEIIDEKQMRQRRLARELGERVDVLRVELEDTRREAELDPLTKLGNRTVLQRELSRAAQVRTLVEQPACLLMIDVDDFKQVNDVYGHGTGDATLEAVARALTRCFPRRTDVVTRFGGDEFAVILRDATAADGGRLAARFLDTVRQLEVPAPHGRLAVTASVGVAEALPGETGDGWFARADQALYDAKAEGRDCVVVAGENPPGGARAAA